MSSVNLLLPLENNDLFVVSGSLLSYMFLSASKFKKENPCINKMSEILPLYFVVRKAKYHFVCVLGKWHAPFGKSK